MVMRKRQNTAQDDEVPVFIDLGTASVGYEDISSRRIRMVKIESEDDLAIVGESIRNDIPIVADMTGFVSEGTTPNSAIHAMVADCGGLSFDIQEKIWIVVPSDVIVERMKRS